MIVMKSLLTVVFCSGLAAWGCAAGQGNSDVKGAPAPRTPDCLSAPSYDSPAAQDANYEIQPGDELDISFYLNPEFDDDVVVRPDGKIGLPVVGEINARSLTPAQLAAVLDRANKVIKQIAEQQHYDLIVQEAVYVSPRIDITDQVLKALAASNNAN